ncbi:MAG: DNA polymerase I [Eubacteriales bacterium]|nr:DNA polymerase I [Eubacteriales bacterium]
MKDKLVIIDGNSLINRAFYALPQLANAEGVISNGVFGFATILVKIITEIKPKYICVALDYGKHTFRTDMYAEYKGTRKGTPEELKSQFPILRDMLSAMGIQHIEKEGIEADDIIGTLTRRFDTENIVVTGDKDSFQLINDNTWVMFTKRGVTETINYDQAQLFNDYGLKPFQIVELKSLMGDSSDNIPGVSGVGEKTALSLLYKYETLDNVYNHIDEITGKLKEKLVNSKEMAYLSHTLATIDTNCDFECRLEDCEYQFPFNEEVLKFFKRYQFNSLLKKSNLFEESQPKTFEYEKSIEQYNIDSLDIVHQISNEIKKEKKVYLNLSGGVSIFVNNREYNLSEKVDLLTPTIECSDLFNGLKDVFEDETIEKCVFDYKSILHTLKKYNVGLNNVSFDVYLARYLINNNNKSNISFEDLLIENNLNLNYRAYNLKSLEEMYIDNLNQLQLTNLYNDIELPLTKVLYNMEIVGFKIDQDVLYQLDSKFDTELKQVSNEIYDMADCEFNLNSPKQLGEVLFDKMNLYHGNNKKKSTGIDVLNSLKNDHPIIEKIIRYRQISKLYSTYIKSFEELINKDTGKIYTTFNQTLTSTGRLSSSDPNLQNIPVRSEEGKELRKMFVPSTSDGYIVSADYSQIELRLLASFCGDEKLIEAFSRGDDIHALTASQVFGVDLKDVTSQMRRDAKAINFGIIYGISDYGLSQNIGSTRKAAKEYIDTYFLKYPLVKKYMDDNVEYCKKNGYIKTYFGRIRFIPEINNSNYNIRQLGERCAMNMPLQGSASDIIKLAMIRVYNRMKYENLQSKLILQIHDELIVDCVKSELEKVTTILKEEMENVVDLKVKLEVNVSYGKDWYEAK